VFNHEIFAVSFGRALELTRAGAPVEERKSALSAVYALTSNASAMMRVYQSMLTVDDVGIPDTLSCIPGIIERMTDHGVAEVAIGKGASPVELLALIRGLAAEPGSDGGVRAIKLRLRDAQSTAVMVIPAQRDEEAQSALPHRVTAAFDSEVHETPLLEFIEPETPADAAPADAAPPQGEPPVELPAMMHRLDLFGPPPSAARDSRAGMPPPPRPDSATTPPAAPQPVEPLPPANAAGQVPTLGLPVGPPRKRISESLAEVAREPFGANTLDRLTDLYLGIQAALEANEVEPAVHALSALIAWEPEAPAGSAASYRIVLQRILTREHLALMAPFVGDPRLGAEVIKVMQRGGAEAAEALVALLLVADDLKDRRALVTALRGIPEGLAQVVRMLDHPQWFLVRNVAEAMGFQRVEEAVPGLVRCLAHGDARVRRAAATALARIGTPQTVEPLRRVLKEGDPEMRALVASSIGGHGSRALAMPLVAFAEQESDLNVLREYYRALGRIGTPDAVQALARAAESGGRLLGRRPSAQRVAAVEGLRIAAGRLAKPALQALASDSDRAVRELAVLALGELTAREASLGT
jgi:HEAT repeat protein